METLKLLKEWVEYYWSRILVFCGKTYAHIRWSPWNPWAIGSLNLAWSKYVKTPMYDGRVEFDEELRKSTPNYEGDYPLESFIANNETDFFLSMTQWKDKIRLVVAPFSFGNKFRMPIYLIRWWFLGIDKNEVL